MPNIAIEHPSGETQVVYVKIARTARVSDPGVRHILLSVKFSVERHMQLEYQITIDIITIIENYFKSMNAYSLDSWIAPDGQVYQPNELAVWVTEPLHAPFGPCPVCIRYGIAYQQGASPQYLWELMQSAEHTAIHIDSRVHRPVCYCRIVPLRNANLYRRGELIHVDEGGNVTFEYPTPLPEPLMDLICQYLVELNAMIKSFAEAKAWNILRGQGIIEEVNGLAAQYMNATPLVYPEAMSNTVEDRTLSDPLFRQVNRDKEAKKQTFGELR